MELGLRETKELGDVVSPERETDCDSIILECVQFPH